MTDVVVGVDGGNSKTEVAVADTTGRVLTIVRGPGSSPDKLGEIAAAELIERLVAQAVEGLSDGPRIVALAAMMAGLDLPGDASVFSSLLQQRFAGSRIVADNDTIAVLLAGTGGAPGGAVVCGAGINAVAQDAEGRRVGFLSLGRLTGDWGGGMSLGREVLWSAIRDEDGRGPATMLRAAVLEHFTTDTVTDLALKVYRGEVPEPRLAELVPALLRADLEGDPVAGGIVARLIREISTMAEVILQRSGLRGKSVPLVLAGGVITGSPAEFMGRLTAALDAHCPTARVDVLESKPVAGALVAALQAMPGDENRDPVDLASSLRSAVLRTRSGDVSVNVDARNSA